MFCVLFLIVNILGPGSGSGLHILNTNNSSDNIEQLSENTDATIISDIEEEEEGAEEEGAEEETTLQQGSSTKEIGLKQKAGKKNEDMVRTSSDTPSSTEVVGKQKLIDKSKKISKDNETEARDKRHRPRQETFTMEAERKYESCEAKTSGWAISMEACYKLDLHDFIQSW